MRRLVAAAGIAFVLLPATSRAGLYNTAEQVVEPSPGPNGVKAIPFRLFQQTLTDLQNIAIDKPDNPIRERYVSRRDALQAKERQGALTVEERVNLGAYLIRLRQYDEAIQVLRTASAQDPRNFMVLANLGTAYQLRGELPSAAQYLSDGLQQVSWDRPGWSKDQQKWYRRAETYHRKLVRLRGREALQGGGRAKPPETVDALFDDGAEPPQPVRFVGDDGRYEPGKLAAAERAKLPKDAVAIVQQLLIWLPDDTRLYWLLGELLNAEGDVESAQRILDDCVWTRAYPSEELKKHRQVLAAALPPPEAAAPAPAAWVPDSRHLIPVGVVAGLLIAGLAYLQIREIRRRRRVRV
jgi:tetratricopeptide (TPR) repeat protein